MIAKLRCSAIDIIANVSNNMYGLVNLGEIAAEAIIVGSCVLTIVSSAC